MIVRISLRLDSIKTDKTIIQLDPIWKPVLESELIITNLFTNHHNLLGNMNNLSKVVHIIRMWLSKIKSYLGNNQQSKQNIVDYRSYYSIIIYWLNSQLILGLVFYFTLPKCEYLLIYYNLLPTLFTLPIDLLLSLLEFYEIPLSTLLFLLSFFINVLSTIFSISLKAIVSHNTFNHYSYYSLKYYLYYFYFNSGLYSSFSFFYYDLSLSFLLLITLFLLIVFIF